MATLQYGDDLIANKQKDGKVTPSTVHVYWHSQKQARKIKFSDWKISCDKIMQWKSNQMALSDGIGKKVCGGVDINSHFCLPASHHVVSWLSNEEEVQSSVSTRVSDSTDVNLQSVSPDVRLW